MMYQEILRQCFFKIVNQLCKKGCPNDFILRKIGFVGATDRSSLKMAVHKI